MQQSLFTVAAPANTMTARVSGVTNAQRNPVGRQLTNVTGRSFQAASSGSARHGSRFNVQMMASSNQNGVNNHALSMSGDQSINMANSMKLASN